MRQRQNVIDAMFVGIEKQRDKSKPAAYMHPNGAIWRVDNCPSDINFDEEDRACASQRAAPQANERCQRAYDDIAHQRA